MPHGLTRTPTLSFSAYSVTEAFYNVIISSNAGLRGLRGHSCYRDELHLTTTSPLGTVGGLAIWGASIATAGDGSGSGQRKRATGAQRGFPEGAFIFDVRHEIGSSRSNEIQ